MPEFYEGYYVTDVSVAHNKSVKNTETRIVCVARDSCAISWNIVFAFR